MGQGQLFTMFLIALLLLVGRNQDGGEGAGAGGREGGKRVQGWNTSHTVLISS